MKAISIPLFVPEWRGDTVQEIAALPLKRGGGPPFSGPHHLEALRVRQMRVARNAFQPCLLRSSFRPRRLTPLQGLVLSAPGAWSRPHTLVGLLTLLFDAIKPLEQTDKRMGSCPCTRCG